MVFLWERSSHQAYLASQFQSSLEPFQSLQLPHFLYVADELLWHSQFWHHVNAALQEEVQVLSGPRAVPLWPVRKVRVHCLSLPTAVRLFTVLPAAAPVYPFHLQVLHALGDVAHTGRRILQSVLDTIRYSVFMLRDPVQKVSHRGWDGLFRMLDLAPAPYSAARHKETTESHSMAHKGHFNDSWYKRDSGCFCARMRLKPERISMWHERGLLNYRDFTVDAVCYIWLFILNISFIEQLLQSRDFLETEGEKHK